MKRLLGAVLFAALVTEGCSLICHRCNSLTGSCALNTTTECNRTIHSTCRSISVNDVFGFARSNYLLSGCGNCFGLISFSSGILSRYVHTTCCSSSLCNNDVVPDIENSTLNGLECHGCFAVNGTCTNVLPTVKCRGEQDHCVHTSGLLQGVRPLTCNQCVASSGSCMLREIKCPSGTTTCSTTSTTEIYSGVTNKRIRNSCGQCSDPIAFNTGVVVFSQSSSCCHSDLCNNQIFAEPANSTQNGLKCQGCFNISSHSCRDSEQTVKCVGAETRCITASGQEALSLSLNNFIAKGCVSKQVCRSLDILRPFRIQFTQLPTCCTGNLCNGDPGSGTSTLEPGVITSRPMTTDSSSRMTANGTGGIGCIIGLVTGVTGAVLIAMGICYYQCKKKKDSGPI
ncbi:urokinase plasminogen activator surface receptor-like isoform X2 [Carcharodon carcharias]|uniref:urokinase plasminogen activator surface receptor-like isoform X2 n=1 Tax=Carcharodon carcharias TaxID=13397 RepID=UPI001B7E9974|nr:urokinase plasminogen activator surface receptor-like isoform X2 [Carcharodon carcharias]